MVLGKFLECKFPSASLHEDANDAEKRFYEIFIHILERVTRPVAYLEVDVRTRRAASRTYVSDDLTLHDSLADRDDIGRVMSVERLRAFVVTDNNIGPIPAVPP